MDVKLQRHSLGITWVEQNAMARAAHALVDGERVWLIDPYEHAPAMSAAAELGPPAGVVQLLNRHNRDCAATADRLGVPLLRLPTDGAGTPFEVIPVLNRFGWHEVALWWAAGRALVIAEAIGTSPAFALSRRAGVHPMLRLIPPRHQFARFSPDRLFPGHGPALESGADEAIREALAHSRADIPRLLVSLPKLLHG
jgi:hypothetical protein